MRAVSPSIFLPVPTRANNGLSVRTGRTHTIYGKDSEAPSLPLPLVPSRKDTLRVEMPAIYSMLLSMLW